MPAGPILDRARDVQVTLDLQDISLTRHRETLKRVLVFPPDTKVEWKSHDSSIAQRTAIDEQRKEKGQQQHRNGKDDQSEKKTAT